MSRATYYEVSFSDRSLQARHGAARLPIAAIRALCRLYRTRAIVYTGEASYIHLDTQGDLILV